MADNSLDQSNDYDGGGDAGLPPSVFRGMSVEELRRGTIFKSDLEQDFELHDLYESDEDSETDDPARFGIDGTGGRAKAVNLYTPPLLEGLADACQDVTPDGGVKKLVLTKGTGVMPPAGCKLFFDYVGFLTDGAEHFDASTRSRGEGVMLGEECGLIPGLRLALESMQISEVAQFLIQPDYAFGKMGCPPRIPEEAMVIFNVRIVSFLRPDQLKNPVYMTKEQRNKLSFQDVYAAGRRLRDEGNALYTQKNYSKAVRSYRQTIDMLEDYWGVTDAEVGVRATFLCCVYANLAQCYLQMKKGPQACNACKNGLKQPSTNYKDKLFFRFAKAKLLVNSYADALHLLKEARRAGAGVAACDELREEILAADARSKDVERQLCQIMMGRK